MICSISARCRDLCKIGKIWASMWNLICWRVQVAIMANPKHGSVIKGTGGLRKLEFAPPRGLGGKKRGKRNSCRVCYAYFEEFYTVLLVMAYSKGARKTLVMTKRRSANMLLRESTNISQHATSSRTRCGSRSAAMKRSIGNIIGDRLTEFADALEDGGDIRAKFTCRKVVLNLVPKAYQPSLVKKTRAILSVSQSILCSFSASRLTQSSRGERRQYAKRHGMSLYG